MVDFRRNFKDLTLLIVEDDKILNHNLTKSLSHVFGKVMSAYDGQEALEIYQTHLIDIIILDFSMPKLDGYEFCRFIRKHDDKIPLIMMSCYTDTDKLLKSIRCNLIDYLVKPIKYDDLMVVLNEALIKVNAQYPEKFKIDGDLWYNYTLKVLECYGQEEQLTRNEALMLELLIREKNTIVSYEKFEYEVYQKPINYGVLKNQIARLRKRMKKDIIKSIRNFGYKLCID